MQAIQTILVPLDGSASAEQVLPYVRMLAPILGARVHLLRVLETVDGFDEIIPMMYVTGEPPERTRARVEQIWKRLREAAEGYLEPRAGQLRALGLVVSGEVCAGSAPEAIVEAATSAQAPLIAMATHGYSGIKRWAMGSVTDKVVQASTVPVLVVRAYAQAPADPPTLRRVLVPLDSSSFARQALPIATELARRSGAELVLLEAVDGQSAVGLQRLGRPIPELEELTQELRRRAQTELDMLVAGMRSEGINARAVVEVGAAADVIVDQVAEQQADMVVMATHGYSGIKRWTLGSVADKVLQASAAPLLLVRPKEE